MDYRDKARDFAQRYTGQRAQWYAPDGDIWTGTIIGLSPVYGCITFKADPEYHTYKDMGYHADAPQAFRIIDNTPLPLPG